MKKKIIISILANTLLFGTAVLLINKFTLLLFIGLIYIAPLIMNGIVYNSGNTIKMPWLFSTMSTIGYCIFSYIFMNQVNTFENFITENSKMTGDLSIQIQDNLLNIGQVLFVFIINFGVIYISNKLVRRNINVANQGA